ncbi:hypothetical protein GCM10023083_69420 [Streptomyces phyllanthi]
MPGSAIITAAPEGAVGFLYLAWKGILGILGFCLALNVHESAYRIYELATSRGPFAPGPGFSPLVIRIVGALIGAVSTWSCVQGLAS